MNDRGTVEAARRGNNGWPGSSEVGRGGRGSPAWRCSSHRSSPLPASRRRRDRHRTATPTSSACRDSGAAVPRHGCGGDGSIGEVIPTATGRLGAGVRRRRCSSTSSASIRGVGVRLADEFYRANPGAPNYWWPDGWPVSNNPRTRSIPVSPSFFSHGTVVAGDGSVPFAQPGVPFSQDASVWILITGGQAQWAVSGRVSLATPTVPAPPAPAAAVRLRRLLQRPPARF